jgi:type IV fimbrial biogenesis protein FimT
MLDHEQGIIVLNALPTTRPLGFTLIEMLIVVTIIAIATTLGIPSYRAWVQNTQIYNAADSVQNGLQKAQAEAVKQNTNIEFVLGANPPWQIKVAGTGGAVIESSTNEGAKNVTTAGLATDGVTAATTITFSNLGGVVANASVAGVVPPSLARIDFNSAVLAGSRNLRVTIGILNTVTNVWVGSNIRMCDPNMPTGTSPRAC